MTFHPNNRQAFISNLMEPSGKELSHQQISMMLFENAAEGLIVADSQGRILLINPRISELFGYSHAELIGKPVEMLMEVSKRAGHVQHRHQFAENPKKRPMGQGLSLWAQRKDGSVFPIEISLNYFTVNDQLLAMALITDITERKKVDQELHQLMHHLEEKVGERTRELAEAELEVRKALQKEVELNQLKSRFVSIASHEFRTPLGTILSSTALIEKYLSLGESDKQGKHLQRIRSAVGNLNTILNDFLSLEKVEAGRIENRPSAFPIRDFLEDLVEEIQVMVRKDQQIIFSMQDNTHSDVCLDRQLLKNILNNLLSNAIKYSPEGASIFLEAWSTPASLQLKVSDQGIGIPKSEQGQLFDRFFRAQNVSAIQGTGLGLHIVKKYLDLMGGDISFQSIEGEGSSFLISFNQQERSS